MEITKLIKKINSKKNNSKTFKIIGNYILEHIHEVSNLKLNEIALKSDTSTATVVRFCKAIDFQGYSDFRYTLSNSLNVETIPTKEFKESIVDERENMDVIYTIIDTNIEMLQRLKREIDISTIFEVVHLMKKTKTIYIIGNRLSYTFAYYFFYILQEIRENIEILIPDKEDYTQKLLYINSDDMVIAVCFYPYVEFTYKLVRFLKKRNCVVVSLTDDLKSPFVEVSDKILFARNNSETYSFVSAITILNIILLLYGKKNKKATLENLKALESILDELNVYVR